MAKATPKIEIGTMFDKNRSLHIERIQRLGACRCQPTRTVFSAGIYKHLL